MAAGAVFIGNAAFQGRPKTAAAAKRRRRRCEWGGIDDRGKIQFSVGKAGRVAMQRVCLYTTSQEELGEGGNMHLASTGVSRGPPTPSHSGSSPRTDVIGGITSLSAKGARTACAATWRRGW